VVFGDSVSAAYGLAQARGWVALLGERLKRERPDYIVVNASISGETSAGGLARINKVLQQHQPAIVVVELGPNDGLRGLPIAEMKKNLAAIIERSAATVVNRSSTSSTGRPDASRSPRESSVAAAAAGPRLPFI